MRELQPHQIVDGGSWYPQVVGLEDARGTDSWAGQTARFFTSGRSDLLIEFVLPHNDSPER